MMKIINWFNKNQYRKHTPVKVSNKKDVVIKATNFALNRYSKTFKDLASYDRREKIYH